ncbi:hypothetical protein ACFC0C_16435 [Streptomyces sp. NPDC056178]|uniref:hypothetical protein n=1 Tax=unclassified Streptomyces TaxID=2593676 RepID=UPI0035D584EC
MALIDDADVFFGSTPDGTAYAVLNARLPEGREVLLSAGFRPLAQEGRTYYVQPYGEAKEALIDAYNGLFELTADIVDLTTLPTDDPAGHEVRMTVTGSDVTANARTQQATAVLVSHGFQPCPADGQNALRLPASMTDREKDRVLVRRAEAHLNAVGATVFISLGPFHPKSQKLPAPAPAAAPTAPHTSRSR